MTRLISVTIIYNDDDWTEKKIWVPWEAQMKFLEKEAGIQSGQIFIDLKQNERWVSQKVDDVVVPDGVYNIRFGNEVKLTEGEKDRHDYIEHEKHMMRNDQLAKRRQNLALLTERVDDLEL